MPTVDHMQTTQPERVAIPSIFGDGVPRCPQIPAKAALMLNVVPAARDGAPTTGALGAVTLTPRQSQVYGARSDQFLRLIAFDSLTGQLWQRTTMRPHAAPIGPARAFNPAKPPRPPSGALVPDGFAHQFAVDLPAALSLPADAARYTCVAWLDELVSEASVCLVEENKARFGVPPVSPEPASATPVHIRAVAGSPERADGKVVLKAAPSDSDAKIGRVLGSIGPGVLPKVAPGVAAAPKYLAVLLVSALTHQLACKVARLPGALFDESGCGEFDFEAIDFFPDVTWRYEKPEPCFAICVAGGTVSNAVTIMPEGWKD
jgi:hypothetical protein